MVKMTFTNNQTAFGYAFYMIAASYFKKAVCKSPQVEKSLLLQYFEQKEAKQYSMEDNCIKYMDELKNTLPQKVFDSQMEVFLTKRENDKIGVTFKNEEYVLAFEPSYAGKNSTIGFTFGVKKESKASDEAVAEQKENNR